MKRYTIYGGAISQGMLQGKNIEDQAYTVKEDVEGLWVKWEDYEKELSRITEMHEDRLPFLTYNADATMQIPL